MGPDLPRPMKGHAVVSLDHFHCMIIGGGSDMETAKKDTFVFDTRLSSTLAFIKKADLNMARSFAFAGLVMWSDGKNRIVVAGGTTNGFEESLTTVEMYDMILDLWIVIPESLPFPYSRGNTINIHNVMYLVGGQTADSVAPSKHVVLIDKNGTPIHIINNSNVYPCQTLRVLGFRYP